MDLNAKKIFKTLNPNKIWLPIGIGLGIVAYLFISDPNLTPDKLLLIFDASWLPIVLAFVVLLARDAGYVYRIRTITNQQLSWTSSIYVIILWEFSSAVTPSVVGGTAVAVFILWKEGLNPGKALAFVMLTAIFDNLFFVVAAPLALLFGGSDIFPDITMSETLLGKSAQAIFITSYVLIAVYTLVMSFALFFRPRLFKWILIKITSLPLLRKWKYGAYERGNEIMVASQLLRGKGTMYWVNIGLTTIFIWSARYFLVNCLVDAYADISFFDHIIIFGKHIILWIVMLLSPTPGSSGTAEFFFPIFFKEYLGDSSFIVSQAWRMLTYYPYLILGAIFLPRWIRKVFFKGKKVS